MTAGVPNHIPLLDRISQGLVGDSCQRQRLGIEQHGVLGNVVNDDRAVGHGLIQQRVGGRKRRRGAEVHAPEEQLIRGMLRGVVADSFDHELGFVRRDARLGRL